MALIFDPLTQPLATRLEYWTDAVCAQAMPLEIDIRNDLLLAARLTSGVMGAVGTMDGFGGNHIYTRTDSGIKTFDPECLLVAFASTGSHRVEQDGRQIVVVTGDMVLIDSSRPFRVLMGERFRSQLFAVPKSALRLSAAQSRAITATSLSDRPAVSTVVKHTLINILTHGSAIESDPEAAAIGDHAIDMIGTLIRSAFAVEVDVDNKAAVLRESVMFFIRQHHNVRNLTPAVIATAHHVSLRTLHAAFAATGRSLMETVREIRVRQARQDLTNPYFRQWSIAQIADAHGFTSASDFSRSFRTTHGVTPTEYRETQRTTLPLSRSTSDPSSRDTEPAPPS